MSSVYQDTNGIVDAVRDADPDMSHASGSTYEPTIHGKRVSWSGHGYIIKVPMSNVRFMEGNIWDFNHAAGVLEAMREGVVFELPAARVHRITASDVKDTQRWAKNGELSYQVGMIKPWTREDIGSYSALLVDGNHRAAAAMALGETTIPVYVGENYRDEVRKKDWVQTRRNPSCVDGWWTR